MQLVLDNQLRRGLRSADVEECRGTFVPGKPRELVDGGNYEGRTFRVNVLVHQANRKLGLELAAFIPAGDDETAINVGQIVVAVIQRFSAPRTRSQLHRILLGRNGALAELDR